MLTDEYGHGVLGALRDAKHLAIHLRLPGGEMFTVRQDGTAPVPAEGAGCGVDWDVAREMGFGDGGERVRSGQPNRSGS